MLTTAHIQDSLWEWHTQKDLQDWPRYHLQLFEDGIAGPQDAGIGQTDWHLYATWEVAGPGGIVLHYVETFGSEPPPERDGEILFTTTRQGEIRLLEDSVFQEYEIVLSFGDTPPVILLSEDFTVKPNLRRKVNGVDVITTGAVMGTTTQNVRVRAGPGVDAPALKYGTLDSAPKGSSVRVLARTLEKERVQQWTNYWYYVENTGQEGSPRFGWMFGQFIDIPEDEVRRVQTEPRPWEEEPASPPDSLRQRDSEGEEIDPAALQEYD